MISLLRFEELHRLRRQSTMENQKRPAINFVEDEQLGKEARVNASGYDGLGKNSCGYATENIAPFSSGDGDTHRVTGWEAFPEYKFRRTGQREDIEHEERRVRSRTDFLARRMDTEINMNSISARTLRPSGGKDRHSKVFTAKGPRDRRVRLSVSTAIQFYDVQDRLGYDQPSKAVEWLMKKAKSAIDELSQIPLPGIDRIISPGTSAYPHFSQREFRGPDTGELHLKGLSDLQHLESSSEPHFQDKIVTDISMSVGDRSRIYPTPPTTHPLEQPREYNPLLPSSYVYDMPAQQRMELLQSPLQYHHQQTSLVTVQQTYMQQNAELPQVLPAHHLPFSVVPGSAQNPKQYLQSLRIGGDKHGSNMPSSSGSRLSGFLGGSPSVNPEVYAKPPQQQMEQFDGATSSEMMLSLEEQMHRKRR